MGTRNCYQSLSEASSNAFLLSDAVYALPREWQGRSQKRRGVTTKSPHSRCQRPARLVLQGEAIRSLPSKRQDRYPFHPKNNDQWGHQSTQGVGRSRGPTTLEYKDRLLRKTTRKMPLWCKPSAELTQPAISFQEEWWGGPPSFSKTPDAP